MAVKPASPKYVAKPYEQMQYPGQRIQVDVKHKLIRPFTPRHNGKTERSHRKDNERFYATQTFYSFENISRQLKLYNRRDYNNLPMRPLGWKSPNEVLRNYLRSV